MGLFDIGIPEIMLILIVALIIWGPERIPEIARTLGKTIRTFKKITSDLTTTITKELDLDGKNPPPQSGANRDDKTKESADAGQAESGDTETASPKDQ